jgi:UDP-N-acetylmuramoylalanine--D-glutamate ligase
MEPSREITARMPRHENRCVNFSGRAVVVAGAGVSGTAAARVLRELGSEVTVVDARGGDGIRSDDRTLPAGTELVITSPGWRPDSPLLRAAVAAGVPVWGEVELGWRLRPAGQRWLAITGTNGKTTATAMLGAILASTGMRATTAGNIGVPLVEVVRTEPAFEILAVELSSFQLHWSSTITPQAAAIINIAPDHLDWHGSAAAYAAAKARIWAPGTTAIYGADDPGASAVAAARPGAVGVTLADPSNGRVGIRSGAIYDDAFGGGRILSTNDLQVSGPHNITDALIATALARAAGIGAAAIATGLSGYVAGAHRMESVAVIDGVRFIDDSKGTNPHATAAALDTFPDAVWIAGGLAKGATFDELIADHAQQLRAAVLIGTCAGEIADAFARHAAHVHVIRAPDIDNAVQEAARLARPDGVVLLSPAAASMDMFRDYADRGERFAAAARSVKAAGGQEDT